MAVSVVSFSFFMAAQPDPGVNTSVCWLSLLHCVYLRFPLYCLPSYSPISNCPQFVGLILPSNPKAVIQTRLNACATSSDFQRPGCVTSFRCTTLNGIFGLVKRSKHNTWDVLENKTHRTYHPNIGMLKTAIEEEWNKISEEFILKTWKSFLRWVDILIEKNGGYIYNLLFLSIFL